MTEAEMVRWHHHSMAMSLSKLLPLVIDRGASGATVHRVTKSQTRLKRLHTCILHILSIRRLLLSDFGDP